MKIGPILVLAAVVIGGACTGESQASPATTVATTVPVGLDIGGNPIDLGRLCVHTDPGQLPISVHRALNCPDGTMVSVTGIVVHGSDGSVLLCDRPAKDFCLSIDDGSAAGATGAPIDYTGTVSKGVLTVATTPQVGPGPLVASPVNRPLSPLRSG
jgi:hypothetical protein